MKSEGDKRELRLLHARPSKNSFPSSKEDLEETRLLLLNQIDRLQKLELKEKSKSMVYLDEYDGKDGTYFDVGEELVMLHKLHEALEQEEQAEGGSTRWGRAVCGLRSPLKGICRTTNSDCTICTCMIRYL